METPTPRFAVHNTARRGVAMMMVLSVVATAAILSWAMLSASSLRATLDVNAADAIEASNLAESGVSYALYYLRYPEKSPVALTQSTWDKHYPGQSGLLLWADARGTVNITVTNTSQYHFTIRSTSSVNGTTQTVEADATLQMVPYTISSAAGFNGAFNVPSSMYIDGPVVTTGALSGYTSQISNAGTIIATNSNVVPAASELNLFTQTGVAATGTGNSNDRTYIYNGVTYAAEKAGSNLSLTLVSLRPLLNPCNVWYSDGDITISNLVFNGSLIARNGKVTATGTNTLTASNGMPALLVSKYLDLKSSALTPAKVNVTGAVWLGDRITASASNLTTAALKVDGALLMGSAAPTAAGVAAQMNINYKPANVASISNFSTMKVIAGVNVTRWQAVN